MRLIMWTTFGLLSTLNLNGQDITGDWQGKLKVGATEFRMVVSFAKDDRAAGGWRATQLRPDLGSDSASTDLVSLTNSNLTVKFDEFDSRYEGKLSADGNQLTGRWTDGQSRPLNLRRAAPDTSWRQDRTAHRVQFVTVADNIKLEVLDWGGIGRDLILLAGQGNSAHGFDQLAPKLAAKYHVYGITRRGYGASSKPPLSKENYAANQLGDDVLVVMDALRIERPPVLVGHSLGGEELSSIGSRQPKRVSGLIYLDAGYAYAYNNSALGSTSGPRQAPTQTVEQAIRAGMQKYSRIDVPILAIYALPHERGIDDPAARAAADANDLKFQGAQAKAFEEGLPSARVVRLAHASHYVFLSNEDEVLREMGAFIEKLP